MRIALVTEVWSPTVNGVVTRLRATVDELLAQGHQILVVAPGIPGTQRAPTGLRVKTVPTVSLPFVYGGQPWGLPLPRVHRHLAEFNPDIIHVVNPVSLGIAGVRAARRLGIPLVCSYHTDIAAYARHYHLGWLKPVIRSHLRLLHGRAALNLATSEAAMAQLAHLGVGAGGDGSGAISLWPRGVALDLFTPWAGRGIGGASGKGTATASRPFRALYVGRLAHEKALGCLAPLSSAPNFELTVVGDGPARAEIAATLSPETIFTGTLQGPELAAAYRRADVFVFPSVSETLGLVLLEALASGLPVVAADSAASRELLGRCRAARLWSSGRGEDLPVIAGELLRSASPHQLAGWARAEVAGRSWRAATSSLVRCYDGARLVNSRTPWGPATRRSEQLRAVAAAD